MISCAIAPSNQKRTAPDTENDDRAPMLFIAFGEDHIVPPKVIRHNVRKYDQSRAITAYREVPGRPHFPGAPGWEEVADVALSWAVENATARRPVVVAS